MAPRNAARLATALAGLAALLVLLTLLVPGGRPAERGDRAVLQIHEGGGMGGFYRMRVTLWDSGRVAFTAPDLVLREAHLDPPTVGRVRRAADVLFDLPDRLVG